MTQRQRSRLGRELTLLSLVVPAAAGARSRAVLVIHYNSKQVADLGAGEAAAVSAVWT